VKKLLDITVSLEGLLRNVSTHGTAIVVAPEPLEKFLPLYKDQNTGSIITQYSIQYVNLAGLVVFNILGLKNLTVIGDTINLIRAGKYPDFDINTLPEDDPATFKLIIAGNTTGVFQFESIGMRELLNRIKPTCFEDLIAAYALDRPGPLESGMVGDFIDRKHGRNEVVYDLPQLEPILKDTYGVIVYQEQVMQISCSLAGYSPGQADLLRRAMGKKDDKEMSRQKARFLEGAKANNLDPKKAEAIFDLIHKFAKYSFNKAHATASALMGYQCAYLKAHYPIEFMASQLTCYMDNRDEVAYLISDCREQGIEVLPPDINLSGRSFTVEGSSIRFGLGAVKNVGTGAIEAIIKARENGPFKDSHDFSERVDLCRVNKRAIKSLIKCGAFYATGP
jgi:DNA polymerase-3 subunit alpha